MDRSLKSLKVCDRILAMVTLKDQTKVTFDLARSLKAQNVASPWLLCAGGLGAARAVGSGGPSAEYEPMAPRGIPLRDHYAGRVLGLGAAAGSVRHAHFEHVR